MWLIVGLGNPGPEYENTPHNLGFLAIDRFAGQQGIRVTRPECQSLVGLGEVKGTRVVLAKPQTYMNRSGGAVKQLLAKYELDLTGLLVVYDELALDWGDLRLRPRGSAGGHNGAISIIESLGSMEFARLRLGCSPGHALRKGAGADYLLSPMRRGQAEVVDAMLNRAVEAIESVVVEGVEKSMTKFNRRAQDGERTEQ